MKHRLALLVVLAIIVLAGYTVYRHNQAADNRPTADHTAVQTAPAPAKPATPAFDKHQYSLTDPTSIWVIANKSHHLNPKSYIPPDLVFPDVPLRVPGNESMKVRAVTAKALVSMFAAAKRDGLHLMLSSGYRSYSFQVSLYGSYVKTQGQAVADTQSARPGYSEHQTGLAADIEPLSGKCNVEQCFGELPEGKWLAANAYKYGFVIRYPKGYDKITGYTYEPWHVRYIGLPAAAEVHRTGTPTLEQFFGVSGGQTYK